MPSHLVPGSAKIEVTDKVQVAPPIIQNGYAHFQCRTALQALGSVSVSGAPAAGWKLGFIQVEWTDTNWLHYRGETETDGSIFFQRARPPARPRQVCRDVDPAADIFYTDEDDLDVVGPADPLPRLLMIGHTDSPEDSCPIVALNARTGKANYLVEAQMEFLFCTVLSAQDPMGRFHHLKSFYWNVRWQARFRSFNPAAPDGLWLAYPADPGTKGTVGHVIDGPPSDKRFKDVLTDLRVPACNAAIEAYDHMPPGHRGRRESATWEHFDVRR